MSLRTFTTAYIEAIYFTDGSDAADEWSLETPLAFETLRTIVRGCKAFYDAHGHLFTDDNCLYAGCSPDEYAGHDFWLTRNGHGCGFWDGDWTEPAAEILTKAAEHSEQWTYLGDDGKGYLS